MSLHDTPPSGDFPFPPGKRPKYPNKNPSNKYVRIPVKTKAEANAKNREEFYHGLMYVTYYSTEENDERESQEGLGE